MDLSRSGNVRPIASGTARLAERLTPPSAKPLDPAGAVEDVTLPQSVWVKVAEPMRALGFELKQAERREPYAGRATTVTVARNGQAELVLIHLSKDLLAEVTTPGLMLLRFLEEVLDEGDHVVIFSEGLEWPRKPYRSIVEQWPGRRRILACWISWPDIEDLATKDGPERDLALRSILELEDVAADERVPEPAAAGAGPRPPGPPRWQDLTGDVQKLLLRELTSQAENAFKEQDQFFNELVDQLDVPQAWKLDVYDNWGNQIPTNARRILIWAFSKGRYPPNSPHKSDSVAGALLVVLTEAAFTDDVVAIGRLVVERRLIGDHARLQELKKRLGLDAPVGREGG